MNTLVALCAVGAERVLGNEIKRLGYRLVSSEKTAGRVKFVGDDDALFRANLCLRTADRVYLEMAEFPADNFDLLFDGVYAVDWQNFFKKDSRVVVDKVRVHKSILDSEHTVQSMVHKAVYQKLGDVWRMNSLPESGEQSDIRVYIENNVVSVLLDLSGEPLFKRGYRTQGGVAPIRESTAAVLLQLMLWRRKMPLHDPFCGSGTIALEALLFACDAAPGLGRNFAVQKLPFFNKARADEIKKEQAQKIRTDVEFSIVGSDIDSAALECAQVNLSRACSIVEGALKSVGRNERLPRPHFVCADFKEVGAGRLLRPASGLGGGGLSQTEGLAETSGLHQPADGSQYAGGASANNAGLVLSNPPYGERLGDTEQAKALYKEMSCLFENFSGWQMGFITANRDFQKSIGRYASLLKNIKSGKLDTVLYMYTDR